ncbi:MAG: patatin family protein [Ruminococcaceae bacterium]|nr:patatin family protein [Oscillospiraceae bacterium]
MSVGLVLEGGGQRGAYTAGVLQGLWSEGVRLDYVVGVSAGALTGINYVSGQLRRNYNTFVKYAPDPRYMGVRHIREHGGIFNFDFLLGNIVYDLLPFDFETFFGSSCRMRIGATDCRTGEAVYYDKEALRGDPRLTVLRATASLPLVSKMIRFDGRELLDGGIADPIPLQRSIDDGNDFNIIVLTRNADHIDKPTSVLSLCRRKYRDYPKLVEMLERHAELCINQRRMAYEQQRMGRAVVIQPIAPLKIGRYERNPERLAALHDTALTELASRMCEIRALLARDEKFSRKNIAKLQKLAERSLKKSTDTV